MLQPKPLGGLFDESSLLAGGLDQGKAPLRIDDGQRQARKPGAGADVGDALAAQVWLQAQAVEHMLVQHARGGRGSRSD